jgi:hypothetical protein
MQVASISISNGRVDLQEIQEMSSGIMQGYTTSSGVLAASDVSAATAPSKNHNSVVLKANSTVQA